MHLLYLPPYQPPHPYIPLRLQIRRPCLFPVNSTAKKATELSLLFVRLQIIQFACTPAFVRRHAQSRVGSRVKRSQRLRFTTFTQLWFKKIKNLCKGKQKTWPLFAMQCHERWSVSIAAEIISLVTSRADNEGLKTSFVDKQCQD